MWDFWEYTTKSGLIDLGYEDFPFTCKNKRDDRFIQQTLDCGLATMEWI